uniref:Phytosulfokine n=1 Tax=Kalanchoe fedtschenkoi TaxID=63787 RepID=A0A7N0THX5_KALFE
MMNRDRPFIKHTRKSMDARKQFLHLYKQLHFMAFCFVTPSYSANMPKLSPLTIFVATLLISAAITSAARPSPTFDDVESKAVEVLSDDVGCEGLGVEACLEKETSNAHTDYIYTQRQPKPPQKKP